ncbi:SGNH/GDSL hydrolase family protein [Kocuria rosea]|uniref:SGNH/GDSL hydrolase family protein n=1 Tax=Kocuria rosea TaxID=1275 RepID=UPI00203BA311|nr:SGNH/GDSL hydrolase family protein [Kocuria rosea]
MSASLLAATSVSLVREQHAIAQNAELARTYTPAVAPLVVGRSVPQLAVDRPSSRSLKVLVIGDSLATGLHASNQARGFRPLTIEALEEDGPVEENHGHKSGGTADEVLELTDLGKDNDLSIVELGTNDIGETEIEDFRGQYRELLNTIREDSPDTQFLCAGTWQNRDLAGPYDAVIQDECEASDGVFVSMVQLHENEANRGPAGRNDVYEGPSDTFHPNDQGHQAIADRIMDHLNVS